MVLTASVKGNLESGINFEVWLFSSSGVTRQKTGRRKKRPPPMYLKSGFEIRNAPKAIIAIKKTASEIRSRACSAHEPSSTPACRGHQDTRSFPSVSQGHEQGGCDRVGTVQTQLGTWHTAGVQKERLGWTAALSLVPGLGIDQSCQVEAMTRRDHSSSGFLSRHGSFPTASVIAFSSALLTRSQPGSPG